MVATILAGCLACCLACCLGSASANATERPLPMGETMESIAIRTAFLSEQLEQDRSRAALWQHGWTTVFLGNMAFNAVKLSSADSDDRLLHSVEIAKSSLALYRNLTQPLPQRHGADPVFAANDPLARLARAEALMSAAAERAETSTRLQRHLGIVAINLLGGAVILAFGDKTDAALSTAAGILGGELRLWTEPKQAARHLAAYEHRFDGRATDVRWTILPAYRGLTIKVEF